MARTRSKRLTPRQLEVLALLAKSYSMGEIAKHLNITYRTVTFHKYTAMRKIGVTTNTYLLYFAFRTNIGHPKRMGDENKRK
jgi:DNA-binding CsgD family transcriptional regulator